MKSWVGGYVVGNELVLTRPNQADVVMQIVLGNDDLTLSSAAGRRRIVVTTPVPGTTASASSGSHPSRWRPRRVRPTIDDRQHEDSCGRVDVKSSIVKTASLLCALLAVGCGNDASVVQRSGQPAVVAFDDRDGEMAAAIREARDSVQGFIAEVAALRGRGDYIAIKAAIPGGPGTDMSGSPRLPSAMARFTGLSTTFHSVGV